MVKGPWYWSVLTYSYGRAGQSSGLDESWKTGKMSRHEQLDPVIMLWAHLGVGDKEEALADLEKAYFRALRFSDQPQGRTGPRPAAQRPAVPGFIAPRRLGTIILAPRSPLLPSCVSFDRESGLF